MLPSLLLPALLLAQPPSLGADWASLARSPAHPAASLRGPDSLAAPRWVRAATDAPTPITFIPASGPVAGDGLVFALARLNSTPVALALDALTGRVAWIAPIDAPIFDSWAAPAFDERRHALLVASGHSFLALRARDGLPLWSTPIPAGIVNASPIPTDLLARPNRAFITDYGAFGGSSFLIAINLDPFDPASNPFVPGEIVWAAPIGAASGSTPTLVGDLVVVATQGPGGSQGQVLAFPTHPASTSPASLWTFANPAFDGFFGGLAAARDASGATRLYAASYNFFGSRSSSTLFKLDAATGTLVWAVPANRSASIPIPLPDGRVLLAGGLNGFGTVPTLQCFADLGTTASLLWDSAASTWIDANLNGVMDPGEFLSLGGWNHHPAIAWNAGTPVAFAASITTGPGGASTYASLHRLDLSLAPNDPAFVTSSASGAGSSPAIVGQWLFSTGPGGILAFGPRPDVNADGRLDLDDLYAFEQGTGDRDVNADSLVNAADRAALIRQLRADEPRAMARWRP